MNVLDYVFERVMIIDDTKIDRYVASHIIKKNNFANEVVEYDMATKAIEFLEVNYMHPDVLPQVILLDISMPEMDGFQFLDRLSALPDFINNSCCIVMLSSSLSPDDHQRAKTNPIVRKFINKPLDKSDLEEIRALYFDSANL